MSCIPDRSRALALLHRYTTKPALLKHAYAVEAAMARMAQKYGQDETLWRVVGLLHDFDYEQYPTPEEHPYKGGEILAKEGYGEDIRRAIMGHAPYTGTPRDTLMARALFAVDELSGFVTACALVRPDKSLGQLVVSSVRKRFKDKAFARAVSREDMTLAADELGLAMDELIALVVEGLVPVAADLGLNP